MSFHIVLVEPEIPQNTGNISRTCACTGAHLHLVRPLGFTVDSAKLRRAGLDYWDKLDLTYHDSLADFLAYAEKDGGKLLLASSKGAKCYTEATYPDGCFLLFGRESVGLPEELLREKYEDCIRIPMKDSLRCLNLSNSVAVVLYEALRQSDFAGLIREGAIPERTDNQ